MMFAKREREREVGLLYAVKASPTSFFKGGE